MIGSVDILNCGAGHLRFSFSDDPIETERASRVVQDMLKRGYALFVDSGNGKLRKVKTFDPKKLEYIIADGPLYPGTSVMGKSSGGLRSIPAKKVKTTAVGPTSGG